MSWSVFGERLEAVGRWMVATTMRMVASPSCRVDASFFAPSSCWVTPTTPPLCAACADVERAGECRRLGDGDGKRREEEEKERPWDGKENTNGCSAPAASSLPCTRCHPFYPPDSPPEEEEIDDEEDDEEEEVHDSEEEEEEEDHHQKNTTAGTNASRRCRERKKRESDGMWNRFEFPAMREVGTFRRHMREWMTHQLEEATRIRKTLPPALLFSQEQIQRRPLSLLPSSSIAHGNALHDQEVDTEDEREEEKDEEEEQDLSLVYRGMEERESSHIRHLRTVSEVSSLSSASHSQQPISFASLLSSSVEWSAGRRSSVSTLRHRQKRREQQEQQRRRWWATEEQEWEKSLPRENRKSNRSQDDEQEEEHVTEEEENAEAAEEEEAEEETHSRTPKRSVEVMRTYHEEMEREAASYVRGVSVRSHRSVCASSSFTHAASASPLPPSLAAAAAENGDSCEDGVPSSTTRTMKNISKKSHTSPLHHEKSTLQVSDCRELFGDTVPWTVWQWAYRWATLQDPPLLQQGGEKES